MGNEAALKTIRVPEGIPRLLPDWFRRHQPPFRIWSAACATGEEPYSIAIALAEAGLGDHPIEITASDASPSALEKAHRGVYREKSVRALPAELRDKYFERVRDGWNLRSEIKQRVR